LFKSHIVVCYSVVVFLCVVPSARAIPAFARQYGTSCATCHVDFPKLNDFGKAFKDAGFKFPKNDESFIKVPPVMLGSPAQKELWPRAIWPGTIPGLPPIGLRFNMYAKSPAAIKAARIDAQPSGILEPSLAFFGEPWMPSGCAAS